ncbi:hypothetical protein CRM90_09120 [Mycobacterium sp. ENV421]|uniref:hypothetical protein n=1 Tax=Mycobacterium sp. ENV421 TaxID=1213407 RepID=UPI000C9CA8D5|nr:hypothetical protein [Mycobacterium sp. ENV421]PND58136.1 hypothetical protein CRM90_09120 [Mycobacterium sp. ENV421]
MATTEEYSALLTALALIDAYADRDEDSISALFDGQDAAPVVSNLLEIVQRLLRIISVVTKNDPLTPIEELRRRTLAQIAEKGFN